MSGLADDASALADHTVLPGGRVACCLEYEGSGYAGWQSQRGAETVQDALEAALACVANDTVRVHCAGRTDSGVHATAQWVHFDSPCERRTRSFLRGANANLPRDVRLLCAVPVSGDFHARHSAVARHYRYVIANTAVAPALWRRHTTWMREPLDAERMHAAAQALLGEQDFSAFRAASCQSRTPMRCVQSVSVRRFRSLLAIDISANAFLHHMVRNIAGSLIAVGRGRREPAWVAHLLHARDRTQAAATAPPQGLYLTGVTYPETFALPQFSATEHPLFSQA